MKIEEIESKLKELTVEVNALKNKPELAAWLNLARDADVLELLVKYFALSVGSSDYIIAGGKRINGDECRAILRRAAARTRAVEEVVKAFNLHKCPECHPDYWENCNSACVFVARNLAALEAKP